MRRIIRAGAVVVLGAVGLTGTVGASSTHRSGDQQRAGHPITICHRTDSETHPYVRETVDAASTDVAGHEHHTGSVWFFGHPKKPKWGDIVPPTDDDHDRAVTPLNWS